MDSDRPNYGQAETEQTQVPLSHFVGGASTLRFVFVSYFFFAFDFCFYFQLLSFVIGLLEKNHWV